MVQLKKHLDLLGTRVFDRVTGFEGVVTAVSFDLYGCIQAVVTPKTGEDGASKESGWYDVGRLRVLSEEEGPVMPQPEFDWTPEVVSRGGKGPANKPAMGKG